MCSRLFWNTNKQAAVVTRSMDWEFSFGERLVVYRRGLEMSGGVEGNPARWTSRYGSVCALMHEFMAEFGLDPLHDGVVEGVNEKGFAAHLLYLDHTRYEERDDRPGVSYSRWARYLVDNCATVAEAVRAMRQIQIVPITVGSSVYPVHAALADADGDSAILEFISGNLVIHHGREHTVMTNEPAYPIQLANLARYRPFGGPDPMLPGGIEPEDRFVRGAAFLKTLPEPKDAAEATAFMFGLIRNVSVPFGAPYRSGPDAGTYPTWWVSATDLTNRRYYFNWTHNPNVVWVDLDELDFAAGQPVGLLDPRRSDLIGDVTGAFESAA
jgi:choloylglycine hydrolase